MVRVQPGNQPEPDAVSPQLATGGNPHQPAQACNCRSRLGLEHIKQDRNVMGCAAGEHEQVPNYTGTEPHSFHKINWALS